jgi:phosphate-selective porin OprO and OprP
MKKIFSPCLLVILSAFLIPASQAQDDVLLKRISELETKVGKLEEQSSQSLRGYWKNGFIFEQPDKSFKLQLGGRIHLDAAFFDADEELEEANGEFNDGVKFRRARLFMRGTIYDNLDFVAEYDFAGSLGFRNVYMGVKQVPVVGNVRVGHQLEPMGLEELASNNHITFMERGLMTAINPAYNTGILTFDSELDKRMTWAAGIFKDTDSLGDSVSNEEFAVTARITGLPYYADDGKEYMHLGGSYSYRQMDDAPYRIRARPDSFIAPYVVDTKNLPSDTIDLYALESMLTLNSLSIQSEWLTSAVDQLPGDGDTPAGDVDFQTYYVMASYILTGEYRPYNKATGYFTRVTPTHNATGKSWGSGAWEIAARYNFIDLNDGTVNGGEMETYTAGLNWYLNPHTRIMWNYVMADVKDEGDADIFETRFQVDF